MSTATIATTPGRSDGSLLTTIAKFFAAAFAPAQAKPGKGTPSKELSLWQLYRLTVGYDSISPAVAAELRKKLVGN